jgi:mRNA-degrading endonuclease RelE of RelBE toxin-antitoxin system
MATSRVVLTPAAQRQLGRLSGSALAAVRGVILGLAAEPFPPGVAKLAGTRDVWRVRLRIEGRPWRIVYQLRQAERMVVVTRVVRRDQGTYRGIR